MSGSYDDGESLPDPDDDFDAEHHPVLNAIRAIPDRKMRRVLMMLFVLAIGGRVGRNG